MYIKYQLEFCVTCDKITPYDADNYQGCLICGCTHPSGDIFDPELDESQFYVELDSNEIKKHMTKFEIVLSYFLFAQKMGHTTVTRTELIGWCENNGMYHGFDNYRNLIMGAGYLIHTQFPGNGNYEFTKKIPEDISLKQIREEYNKNNKDFIRWC